MSAARARSTVGLGVSVPALVVAAGILLRLLHLDADPNYYAWIGYITDEGRWVKHAREVALFGAVLDDDWAVHVHLAPLFHLAQVAVFEIFGVSFLTARLVPALAGSVLVVVAWRFLRRLASAEALLVVLMLLAFNLDLVAMSRVAIPEMVAMCFELIAFVVVLTPPPSRWRMVVAGFCACLAVATKATALPIIPVVSAAVVLVTPGGVRSRSRNALGFAGGLVAPLALVGLVGLRQFRALGTDAIGDSWRVVQLFLKPSSFYDVVSIPFESTLGPLFNLWGLVACYALVGFLVSRREGVESPVHRCYVAALIWTAVYGIMTTAVAYFPDRYKIHLLIPLAIGIATGLTLFQNVGLTRLGEALRHMAWPYRLVVMIPLALPTAAFWAPLLASGYHVLGGDATRVRIHVVSVVVALTVTVILLDWRRRHGQSLLAFVVFPVIAALAWLVSDRMGFGLRPFWPTTGDGPWTWWLAGGWCTIAAAFIVTAVLRYQPPSWRLHAVTLATAGYVVLSVATVLSSYIHPEYTLKRASEDLGRRLAGSPGVVAAWRTESLFIANTVPYRVFSDEWDWRPAVLVAAFTRPDRQVERDYRLIERYEVFISPRYHDAVDRWERLPIWLYVAKTASGRPGPHAESSPMGGGRERP